VDPAQVQTFCHQLRGSKTNWVKDIQFYLVPSPLLSELLPYESTSPHWTATIIDNRLYLNVDGHDFDAEIKHIDIWEAYQQSLLDQEPSTKEGANHPGV
jgi:hypothetical protein